MSLMIKTRPVSDRPNYVSTCKQTVTLYNVFRSDGTTCFHKTVFEKSAFLESKKSYQETKTGITASNQCLLVIPQEASGKRYVDPVTFDSLGNKSGYFTLRKGDKAFHGVGPDVSSAEEWASLISSNHSGVVIVTAIDPKRNISGEIVHVEAGGS